MTVLPSLTALEAAVTCISLKYPGMNTPNKERQKRTSFGHTVLRSLESTRERNLISQYTGTVIRGLQRISKREMKCDFTS